MGRRSTVRILEEAANHAASLMLCHEGDILPVQADAAFVHIKAPGNRVEQRGLAGAVRADDGDKIRRFPGSGKNHGAPSFAFTVPGLNVLEIF